MLSLGMNYDYYHVSDATATTYLNKAYYQAILDGYESAYAAGELNDEGIEYMAGLQDLKASGWEIKSDKEIESIYKSMGIRLGFIARF